jgi:geranylgeranylglycerol-phosphate geranylgeranyltransferase
MEGQFLRGNRVQAFFKLIRVDYSFYSALGVVLSGLLAGDLQGLQGEYVVAFLIVFLSAVGSFAINDYYDLEIDRKNSRYDRPLVSGLLSRRSAIITGLVSFSLVVALSQVLNQTAMVIVITSMPVFFLYSARLKRMFLIKNALIAYAYVVTILLGAVISDAYLEPLIIYFAMMGFLVGMAFEIMLDLGDVEGDKERGIGSIAAKFGLKNAAKASVILYAVIMILDPLPFVARIDPRLYRDFGFLFLVLIPVISYFFVVKSLINNQSKRNIVKLKKKVLVTMQVGSIAYLAGVLL